MRLFPLLGWMLFPGCGAVTGPGSVRGPAGGSVTVRCWYEAGYEDNPKYWCRDTGRIEPWRCSDGHRVETRAGSQAEVRRDRVSIRDNRTQRVFTVTVERLTPADAGTYLCGVHRTLLPDPTHRVSVSVSPATEAPPQTAATETPQTTKQPDSPATRTEFSFSSRADTAPIQFSIAILLLGLAKGLTFLCIVCAVTWESMWYRRSRSETASRQTQ